MSELKCCPFCGGYPAIYGIVKDGGLVWKVRNLPEDFKTQEEAYAAWNRRVQAGTEKGCDSNV